MEAEDIIQQKEWFQLNETEKNIIHEIAATEQEFNLMKKIFVVSKEDLEEVPQISPSVLHTLNGQLQKTKRKNIVYYMYAAAAICIIVLAVFFMLNKNEQTENRIVKTENKVTVPSVDSVVPVLPDEIIKKEESPVVHNKKIIIKTPDINKLNTVPYNDIAVNTTVGGNNDLLEYVTELN